MWVNNKDIYLISETTLKARSLISDNVDASYIVPAIKAAQDIRLVEVIGRALVLKLCQLVENSATVVITEPYKTLLDNFVNDFLLWQTLAEIQIPLWAKTRNEGVVNTQGTEYTPLSRNDVNNVAQYYADIASGLKTALLEYCKTNNIAEFNTCRNTGGYNPANICL